MEDPVYIQFSSYWDEMITTGAVPLIALIYFNLRMILKIRASGRFSHRFVGGQPSQRGASTVRRLRRMSDTGSDEATTVIDNRTSLNGSNRIKSKEVKNEEKLIPTKSLDSDRSGHKTEETLIIVEEGSKSQRSSFLTRTRRTLKGTGSSSHYFQKKREKSTIILVLIVVIFIACHSYRLALKVYEFAHPENNTMEHFERCRKQGRFHIPVVFYVLVSIHHIFLVLNSSINFIIYCCVGKDFRSKVAKLFCK